MHHCTPPLHINIGVNIFTTGPNRIVQVIIDSYWQLQEITTCKGLMENTSTFTHSSWQLLVLSALSHVVTQPHFMNAFKKIYIYLGA